MEDMKRAGMMPYGVGMFSPISMILSIVFSFITLQYGHNDFLILGFGYVE